jgi:hypothetical protein
MRPQKRPRRPVDDGRLVIRVGTNAYLHGGDAGAPFGPANKSAQSEPAENGEVDASRQNRNPHPGRGDLASEGCGDDDENEDDGDSAPRSGTRDGIRDHVDEFLKGRPNHIAHRSDPVQVRVDVTMRVAACPARFEGALVRVARCP